MRRRGRTGCGRENDREKQVGGEVTGGRRVKVQIKEEEKMRGS